MAKRFNISICLDDIPDGLMAFTQESKNGKHYFNAVAVERKEVGKYGDTHFIKVVRKEGEEYKDYIIGNVRPVPEKIETAEQQQTANATNATNDGLPF